MMISELKIPSEVECNIAKKVAQDVGKCLKAIKTEGDKFIVNDTKWYRINPSNKKRGDVVVNSAGFLSKKFLEEIGKLDSGKKEKKLTDRKTKVEQRIDGYIVKKYESEVFSIDRENLLKFVDEWWKDNKKVEPDYLFMKYYQMYCKRTKFSVPDLPQKYHKYFESKGIQQVELRIGIEFETGNIGSSFRALSKLGTLYRADLIDAAVFVTAFNKAACAKIWPMSNRNGSFEELKKRGYESNIFFPLWEIGFAPDDSCPTAKYLKSNGGLYEITPNSKAPEAFDGILYGYYNGPNNIEVVKSL